MGIFGDRGGKVTSTADGFIGVNVGAARDYVKDICGTAIKAAITAAKQRNTVFKALEDGWEGVALMNFEANFDKAIVQLEKTLAKAFAALVKEIAAVTDAMVDQDIHMVERQ